MAMTREQMLKHKQELSSIASSEAKLCLPRNEEGGIRMGVIAAEVGLSILAAATDGYSAGLLVAGIFAVANRLHNGKRKATEVVEEPATPGETQQMLEALLKANKEAANA